ncbi:MAG: hypothetical protein IPL59_17250 [Candidatus Competibacteraceae bacterium]|nr:hypothetical protein [Candidatus Competibacteraceae bacterium]
MKTPEIPETLSAASRYPDLNTFRETLRAFIFEANASARERLLQTNLQPVLQILKQKTKVEEDQPPKPEREQRLSGLSLPVLLQAVWNTLTQYQAQTQRKGHARFESLERIRIVIQRFNHDLQNDDSGGIGSEEQAQQLLQGCLGGLATWFAEDLDARLPVDQEQAQRRRDDWERALPITLHLDTVTFGVSRAPPHLQFAVILDLSDGVALQAPVPLVILAPPRPSVSATPAPKPSACAGPTKPRTSCPPFNCPPSS